MRVLKKSSFYQITFMNHLFPINCYVYEEEDSLTLIDIGTKRFTKHVLSLSKNLNKPVTRLVLTHPHRDHVAGLDYFCSSNQNPIDIFITKRDNYLLEGCFDLLDNETGPKIKGSSVKTSHKPNHFVSEGDKIGSLEVIMTPGHTPGSLSLLDRSNKVLIVGDLVQVRGGLSVAGDTRWLFPFVTMGTWSLSKCIESVEKILHYDFDYLCCGHGDVLENPKPQLERVLVRAKSKLK